jgi:predicted HicB family RNase H-like nuclease
MPERTVLSLRMPTELHDALKKRAEEEGRSLNNYIVRVLLQDEQRKAESERSR